MITTTTALEIDSLKTRLKETWMAGDYDRFSRYMEQGARDFYERLDVPPGCELLDVACGSGQLALVAARANEPGPKGSWPDSRRPTPSPCPSTTRRSTSSPA